MSTHINAKDGAISDKILLPGDPLRAKFIAENFLENYIVRKRTQMKLYQFHFNLLIYYTAQNSLISRLF